MEKRGKGSGAGGVGQASRAKIVAESAQMNPPLLLLARLPAPNAGADPDTQ